MVLFTNLAGYISGAEEILVEFLPISNIVAKLLFYVCAAAVVLFGLKAVGELLLSLIQKTESV